MDREAQRLRRKGLRVDDMTEIKPEITRGNVWSILATLTAVASLALVVFGGFTSASTRVAIVEADVSIIKQQMIVREANERALSEKMSTMQGDIRVIRQILEGPGRTTPR